MSKPYTEIDFSNQLDSDFVWRLKELSTLKDIIQDSKGQQPVLLRALVTMLYAHWEGFVRFAATKYFDYLTVRRLKFSELETQFYINSFLPRLNALFQSRPTVEHRCDLVAEILQSRDKRFSKIDSDLINTKSNLNSEVLRELCKICHIDYKNFEDKDSFIDIFLLKRRNSIAHGEEIYVDFTEIDKLIDEGIGIMRLFKNLIENKIYDKSYLVASAA